MIKTNGQGVRQSLEEVCSGVGDESLNPEARFSRRIDCGSVRQGQILMP
jgi:hypothetical protein